jgi:hypothetical protein
MPIFEQYARGQQLGMQQGQNALARAQFADKLRRQRDVQNILSKAYTAPQAAVPALPETEAMGPVMPGNVLAPYPAQAAQAAVPASFDRAQAANMLMGRGYLREGAALMPEGGEGFTLKPGEIRYGAGGQVIAKGGEAAQKPQWKTEEVAIDGGMKQKFLYNAADPTQRMAFGKPYKSGQKGPDLAGGLRKEFTNQTKDFVKVRDAYRRIEASATDPSPAGDLALIFNYMKVLDPGSTVREGEFATAQNAAGVPTRVINTYNRVMSGERLAPEQRNDFVGRAQGLYQAQEGGLAQLEDQYTRLAQSAGVDPQDVIVDYRVKSPEKPPEGDIATPQTDEEYNALPSGALFIDPDDGKQYRKP